MSLSKMSNFINKKSSLGPHQRPSNRWGWGCLFLSTPSPVCLPCAISRAPTTCTITLLLSLAVPGGGFDVPKPKCPPDRGSSDCVTGSPASMFSASNSPYFSSYHPTSKHSSTPSNPRPIPPSRTASTGSNSDLATPPLTPDNGSDGGPSPAGSDKNQIGCP
ncbi:hypothetical protein B0H11DRAFT_899305 [Mycena galericulata]|nr:hypothetical protein B0H11DRAFT_899305 [Mycena galericulata]